MPKAPQLNSFLNRGEILSDDVTDVIGSLASNEGAIENSIWNLSGGDAPLDSTQTDAAGVSNLTIGTSAGSAAGSMTPATASSGDIGATLAALNFDTAPVVTVANGATVEIDGASAQSVTFAGTTGTLKIDDSQAFAGHVSGLTGSDALDLADVSYGANTTASFSGDAHGGTLTVTDGTDTAHVALLGDYLTSGWTLSSDGHGGTVVVDPPLAMPGDGSANGPGGTPQFANILSGYTVRPSWQVAGVDYAVGITAGTALKDPATINMAGVTVDAKNHQIIVTAANVTLDGYDFSLAGGWGVATQAANTTISNSYFKIGSNGNFTIYGDTGSSNLTVKDCVIDGNYLSDNLNNGLIYTSTPGLTVEYTLLEHGYSDFIQAQDGGQITLKYNVLNNNGNVNAHPDWLQTMGTASSPFTETIEYNTVYMTPNANDAGTQGFMLNDNGSTLSSAEFAYNTIVALPGTNVSPITTLVGSNITGTATVHDNFVDSRGGSYGSESFFADPAYSANAMYYNNNNMSTGGLYYQNVATSPTAPIAPLVNPLVAPVATDPTLVPSVVITSDTVNGNIVTLKGTANSSEAFAYSTVQIFDGSTQIGLADTNAAGAWSFTTGALAAGTHSFTARANNYFGYDSPISTAFTQTISGTTGGGTTVTAPPAAPTIASFSTDSGVVGDHITNDSTPTLTGTAVANSTVQVFDGTTQVGTATTDSSGHWTLTTTQLADGSHSLTATDTVAGTTSTASSALTVTVDTVAPNAPVETGASIVSGTTQVQLAGTAEANSTLQVFDGTTQIGTATANSSGAWSLTTGGLASGGHSFTTKATDAAGNT
ncbi:MAG: Ig-like domain-containing protein, partial [Limisphaerales bacterium]